MSGRYLICFVTRGYFSAAIWPWLIAEVSLQSLRSDAHGKEATQQGPGWHGQPACHCKLAEGSSHGPSQALTTCMSWRRETCGASLWRWRKAMKIFFLNLFPLVLQLQKLEAKFKFSSVMFCALQETFPHAPGVKWNLEKCFKPCEIVSEFFP